MILLPTNLIVIDLNLKNRLEQACPLRGPQWGHGGKKMEIGNS